MLHSFEDEDMEDAGREAIALLRRMIKEGDAFEYSSDEAEAKRLVNDYDKAYAGYK